MIKYVVMTPEEVEEDVIQAACKNDINKTKIR